MARPPLQIGSWGEISTWIVQTDDDGDPTKYKSQARYRDHDGHVRPVSAYAKTKAASKRALLTKLQHRAKTSQAGVLTAMHRVADAVALWEAKFEELVSEGQRSPSSLDTCRRTINNHVLPAVGELRIGEASTPRIDRVISEIKKRAGTPTARTSRSIISGVMGLAVRTRRPDQVATIHVTRSHPLVVPSETGSLPPRLRGCGLGPAAVVDLVAVGAGPLLDRSDVCSACVRLTFTLRLVRTGRLSPAHCTTNGQ